jgi:hypothetical protein
MVEWNTDILESDVTVSVRGIVVTEDTEHAVDGDTGSVVWDEDDRLLLVCV